MNGNSSNYEAIEFSFIFTSSLTYLEIASLLFHISVLLLNFDRIVHEKYDLYLNCELCVTSAISKFQIDQALNL